MTHQSRRIITNLCRKDELTFTLVQNGFDRDTGGCGYETLTPGQRISFELTPDKSGKAPKATALRLFS